MASEARTEDGAAWTAVFKEHRAKSGLSLEGLATACGIAKNTVWRWENDDKAKPTADVWPALHKALPGLPPPPGMDKPKPTYEELVVEIERLRELAMVDELTELPNYRATEAAIDKALRKAHRGGETLALAHLDLDHFKRFNDEDTSHRTGDEVLKAFAASAAGCVRDDDFFGRHGGEEFVAIFHDVTEQQARMLAERIRGRVEGNKVKGHRVTCSIGVSVYHAPDFAKDEDAGRRGLSKEQCKVLREQLLAQADAATYWAKADGRNRVVLWSAEEKARREIAAAERKAREAAEAERKAREAAAVKAATATTAPPAARPRRRLPVAVRLAAASLCLLILGVSIRQLSEGVVAASEGTGCKPTPTLSPSPVPDCVAKGDCIDH